MIRLLFLIPRLVAEGAERQLTELVKGLDKSRFDVTVVTFYDGGALRPEIEGLEGVQVLSLQKQSRWDLVAFVRLRLLLRRLRPHIVHGYMGVANNLCLLGGRTVGARVVWGLRASDMVQQDWTGDLTDRLGAWLSRFPDLIIANSEAGLRHHVAAGYCAQRMIVIPNGINTRHFAPDGEAGKRTRQAWGTAAHQQLVGLVGRLHPQKDPATFLRAAACLARTHPAARFVCIGDGPASYQRRMQALATELGLAERLIWAGPCGDMVAAYNALDLLVSSSSTEGFSNVIGEAMACAIPCVVTDVGDSARIVGNAEQVAPRADPAALAAACGRVLDLPTERRAALGRASRERIERLYSLPRLVASTSAALEGLLQ